MDFFAIDNNGLYVINQPKPVWIEQDDNVLYIFNNHNDSEYTAELIKTTLNSSSCGSTVTQRLIDLTKLKRHDFVIASNHTTTWRDIPDKVILGVDYYRRMSNIALSYIHEDKRDSPNADRSFTIKDDATRGVLARLNKITPDVLDALVTAGVIGNWQYVEYPWPASTLFSQPNGTLKPDDSIGLR